jgi:membrane-bound lytic murein transglycosylase D
MISHQVLLSTMLPVAVGLLSGCASTVLPLSSTTQSTKASDQKKDPEIDVTPRSLREKYDQEQQFSTLIPSVEEKKPSEQKARGKKETPELLTEPPTTLQEMPGPSANDELLNLLQKDIDKALQELPGRHKIEFSIPVVENDRVRYFINSFSGRLRGFFERALARSGRYIPMMATILQNEGLPEDLVYLSLIESGFSPAATSRAKAVGPWQFIRGTGLRYGLKINGWLDERRDPVKSTRAAAAYLKDLRLMFGEWFLAAAAYNAGERKVEKAMNRSRTNDFWRLSEKNYLKRETRNYVPKFIAAVLIASTPEKYGFGDVTYELPMEYDEVLIQKPLKLATIAEMANTTAKVIKELNPALLRDITPPNEEGFILRLPTRSGEAFLRSYELLPDSAQVRVITHRLRKGETLPRVAKKYGQTVKQLMEMNGLKKRQVRTGQELIIVLDGEKKKR